MIKKTHFKIDMLLLVIFGGLFYSVLVNYKENNGTDSIGVLLFAGFISGLVMLIEDIITLIKRHKLVLDK